MQYSGCARSRRAVLLRRRVESRQRARGQVLKRNQRELALPELVLGEQERYEFAVLATSLALEPLALAQLYRDRADVENLLDELKNQWGLGRFVTRALKRTRIMVCLNALFYNWWSLFVRLIDPESRREARTSRSLMMDGVGRVLKHSRQTTLLPTIAHSATGGLLAAFTGLTRFLRELQNAPQLTAVERWCRILGPALQEYFRGRVPKPPPGLLPA